MRIQNTLRSTLALYLTWFIIDPLFFFGMLGILFGVPMTVSFLLGLLVARWL